MLLSRHVRSKIATKLTRRRRLRNAIGRYRRLFAASTAVVVVLSGLLLGFVVTGAPSTDTTQAVVLGVGKAGVMDTLAAADTTMAADTASAEGAERKSAEQVEQHLPEGAASYYGDEFAGRPTASGERFDPGRLTAAHRTLPFGTRLRVTNTNTGRSVIVRVNDRGPFSGKRVLDLSFAAAKQIGMVQRGTARVRMEVLK